MTRYPNKNARLFMRCLDMAFKALCVGNTQPNQRRMIKKHDKDNSSTNGAGTKQFYQNPSSSPHT